MNSLFKTIVLLVLACQLANAQNADEKKEPLTMAKALKLGAEELTQYTNSSEAGQDHAAWLYATAKRVQTEHALAQKNVQGVIDLNEWREAIARCRGGSYTLAYIINGGGTMYTHGHARDCAPMEDFLADLAKRLPLAEGKGDAKAVKQIDDTIAFLKRLKPYDVGDAKANKQAKEHLADEVKRVAEGWDSLKYKIQQMSAADAKKIAAFAADTVNWLKEDGGK